MNEVLKQFGYVYQGACSCDGTYTEKFKREEYQVRWRKNRGKFKIKKSGVTITGWLPDQDIFNQLKDIHAEPVL